MKSEGIDVTQQPAHVLRRVKRELKQPPPPPQRATFYEQKTALHVHHAF